MTSNELAREAIAASFNAYSPYSGCSVGAALLTSDGTLYTGCNIENAAFSPSCCAERVAFFKAISENKRKFSAIAIAGGKNGSIDANFTPCGVCRQVMQEFCDSDFRILVCNSHGGYTQYTLNELLPYSFKAESVTFER